MKNKGQSAKRTPVGQVVRMASGRIFSPEEYKKEIYEKYSGMKVFGPYPPTTENICPCTNPVQKIERLTKELLEDVETYKDITVGGIELLTGEKMKPITPFDIIENIEKRAKKILIQKNEYDRCCFPELKLPEISEKEIEVESPSESFRTVRKIISKEA